MLIEASAQSSALFDNKRRVGFLVMTKDFGLLEKLENKIYIIKISKKMIINIINEFSCQIYKKDFLVAKGSFVVKIEN